MDKNLIIDEKLHRRLKIRASEESKTIKELITELIENYLKTDDNKEVKKDE